MVNISTTLQFNLLHKGNNINFSAPPPTHTHPHPPHLPHAHSLFSSVFTIFCTENPSGMWRKWVFPRLAGLLIGPGGGEQEKGGAGQLFQSPPTQVVRPSIIWPSSSGSVHTYSRQLLASSPLHPVLTNILPNCSSTFTPPPPHTLPHPPH